MVGGAPIWREANKSPPYKDTLLQNVTQSFGLGRILWNDLENGKWTEIWNVMCRKTPQGRLSQKIVMTELATYNLDLVVVQAVRWDKGGDQPADDYTFLYEKGECLSSFRNRILRIYGNHISNYEDRIH
jgi:hypothetical protein